MALVPGPPGWAGARRELLDFMVQGETNRGRHTDHPAGRHSMRTKQCPPPPFPTFFTGRMPFLPPNQQCQSTKATILINTQLLTTIHTVNAPTRLRWIYCLQSCSAETHRTHHAEYKKTKTSLNYLVAKGNKKMLNVKWTISRQKMQTLYIKKYNFYWLPTI